MSRTERRRAGPKKYLSLRDIEIVKLIADGYDSYGIAEQIGISRTTVRDHVSHMCRTYGCPMTELPGKTGIGQQR